MKFSKDKGKADKNEQEAKRCWWVSESGMVSHGWGVAGEKEISKEEAKEIIEKNRKSLAD